MDSSTLAVLSNRACCNSGQSLPMRLGSCDSARPSSPAPYHPLKIGAIKLFRTEKTGRGRNGTN